MSSHVIKYRQRVAWRNMFFSWFFSGVGKCPVLMGFWTSLSAVFVRDYIPMGDVQLCAKVHILGNLWTLTPVCYIYIYIHTHTYIYTYIHIYRTFMNISPCFYVHKYAIPKWLSHRLPWPQWRPRPRFSVTAGGSPHFRNPESLGVRTTLWLCQNSYWKWPSRNSGFSHWKWWIFP